MCRNSKIAKVPPSTLPKKFFLTLMVTHDWTPSHTSQKQRSFLHWEGDKGGSGVALGVQAMAGKPYLPAVHVAVAPQLGKLLWTKRTASQSELYLRHPRTAIAPSEGDPPVWVPMEWPRGYVSHPWPPNSLLIGEDRGCSTLSWSQIPAKTDAGSELILPTMFPLVNPNFFICLYVEM